MSHSYPDRSKDYSRLWLVNIRHENKVRIMKKIRGTPILSLLWIKTNLAFPKFRIFLEAFSIGCIQGPVLSGAEVVG